MGLDTKTDSFQVPIGKFVSLENSIFTKGGMLQKRNGFGALTTIPNASKTSSAYLTTFGGDLTAIVNDTLYTYSEPNSTWIKKGNLNPVSLKVLPVVRSGTNQIQADSAVSPSGIACIVYGDNNGTTTTFKYTVVDSSTGQCLIVPTALPSADATYGTPRVFILGSYFVIVYTTRPSSYQLNYLALSIGNPSLTRAGVLSNSYVPSASLSWDALVTNNSLFLAYNTTSGGQAINITALNQNLIQSATISITGETATIMNLSTDNNNIYATYYNSATTTGRIFSFGLSLGIAMAPTTWTTVGVVNNIAAIPVNNITTIFSEIQNTYSYDTSVQTDYINKVTVTNPASLGGTGTVSASSVFIRDLGLASKGFTVDTQSYVLTIQSSAYQPTYFLLNMQAQVIAKIAYSNGPQYYTTGLTDVTVLNNTAYFATLYKDNLIPINKTQGAATVAGVYAQLGVNLDSVNFAPNSIDTTEIGNNLNISGGFISTYDGVSVTEQNFFIWPELDTNVDSNGTSKAAAVISGGAMLKQQYYYVGVYEWSDNQGNIFRSAPSIPVPVAAASMAAGSGNGVTMAFPTLRITYKLQSPPKLVLYRWSAQQQVYYQVTSVTSPVLNDPTVDWLTITDLQSDAQIIGNSILYTTGGVIEDLSPPPSDVMTLFDNRMWVLDSEDRNLLWFSKQVIEATPVEMSDLLTLYVAPTIGASGSTGDIKALYPMDDKLIIFKKDAMLYINGSGPDNTGANNGYSQPVLISSVVGCSNQQSLVVMPMGIMFQSDKGIWLLGRDLGTSYIGAPVEAFTQNSTVLSALTVPGTNQVRFTLNTGVTLMYDYYYQQWGSFINIPAQSSTIYNSLHTYINSYGQIFQETPGVYIDNTSPVLLSFTTSWINFAGLQGFERFYQMYVLGTYITPFKLNTQIAYNYNPSAIQSTIITPSNYAGNWGSENLWGSSGTWGGTQNVGTEGSSNVFEFRLFPQVQKCESFQLTITEQYDSSYGVPAGQGLTLSGMNLIVGAKRSFRTSKASANFG